ncbi:MAG: hypothetical protein WKG03_11880 [Telluria sp.]
MLHTRNYRSRQAVAAIALSISIISGCQPVMSTNANPSNEPSLTDTPLRFKKHNFEANCYSTLSCSVIYDNFNFNADVTNKESPPPRSTDYKSDWMSASYLGIRNFPSSAEVRWNSMDGVAHEARVDIGEIFKDELILHKVPASEIKPFFEGPVAGTPDIFLEVNDRTINVYMRMLIPTKAEQIAGNSNSFFRDDLMLAWSRTY